MFVCRVRQWFAASCLALALASLASAQTPDQARKAIQAIYDKESVAVSKKDAAGILADLAPSYVLISKDGKKQTYADFQKRLPADFAIMKTIKYKGVIQKFQLKGHAAIVTVKENTELSGDDPRTQKAIHVVQDELTEDTWTKGAKGWQRTHSKTLSSKETVNGKATSQ